MNQLVHIVQDTIGLPTELLNPFSTIQYDPGVFSDEYIADISASSAIAIGLALRMDK